MTRRDVVEVAAVALVVAAIHVLFRLSAGFLVGALNDDGVYVVLGKAIAQGEGYRSIHLVAAPVHVRYPPGLPLLLAIPWALGGSLGAVRATIAVVNVAATALAAALVWWLGRRRLALPRWPLAACAIAPFVLDGTIQYYNIPLSEPYLVLGWVAALVLAYPLFDPAASGWRPLVRAMVVGLVLATTALFRTAGIVLLPAVLLALALHRRWSAALATAAAAAVPLLAWRLVQAAAIARGPVSSVPDDLGYWQWLGVDGPIALAGYAGHTLIANTIEYVPKLASYMFPSLAIGVGIVILGCVGVAFACLELRRSHTALVLTTLAASGLTLLWPFAQGRLLLPLLPFLGLLAAVTLARVAGRLPARVAAIGVPALLGVMALAVTRRQVALREAAARAYVTGAVRLEDQSPAMTLAFRSRFIAHVTAWVQARATPGDRIMVDAPAAVYLYTGRQAVAGQPTESRLAATVFGVPGRYLAERIVADSVTVVVWAPPAAALERDLAAIAAGCPHVLARELSPLAAFFRVTRDETCLRQRILQAPAASPARAHRSPA
ncbi:MAG: hypothetical protein Q8Q14_03840 [Gemmatimonadales bacterium]|nr:hypothetical protein [Gemmatimonadales bacterium]